MEIYYMYISDEFKTVIELKSRYYADKDYKINYFIHNNMDSINGLFAVVINDYIYYINSTVVSKRKTETSCYPCTLVVAGNRLKLPV